MNNPHFDALLTTIASAPPEEIDPAICARIARLPGSDSEIIIVELEEILNECITGDLASEFAIWVIDQTLEGLKAKR